MEGDMRREAGAVRQLEVEGQSGDGAQVMRIGGAAGTHSGVIRDRVFLVPIRVQVSRTQSPSA